MFALLRIEWSGIVKNKFKEVNELIKNIVYVFVFKYECFVN